MTVVVPVGARRLVRGFTDVREVDVGDEVRIGDVTVHATPADAPERPARAQVCALARVRRLRLAPHLLRRRHGSLRGMSALAGSLDIALLPVAGWGSKVGPGHLDPLRAAQALRLLKPRLAVPIHWGTFSPVNRSTSADPPEAFRRHAAELAPEVEVRILDPGAALTF